VAKEDKAEVEMTVIHFKTKSDNATLQENIRAIANTLTRALAPPPTQPRIVSAPPAQLHSGNGANNGAGMEQATDLDNFDDAIDVSAKPVAAKKKSAPRYTKPETLELDLESGDVPLKTFLEQKKPEGDIKRYLAIAAWFKQHRGLNEITMDHAYTCYRFMGWNDVPKDVSGPFRAMKKREYGYINAGSAKGLYAINHIGENVVNQMGSE
jgi:hypothetical protein